MQDPSTCAHNLSAFHNLFVVVGLARFFSARGEEKDRKAVEEANRSLPDEIPLQV